MKNRLLAWVLTVAMLLSILPTAVFATETGFVDMPSDYSTEALQAAVDNGLLQGNNGSISPNDSLTRAEMATILVRAFGATESGDISEFTDVSESAWYYDSIAQAVQMGIFTGSDGKMNPTDSITRQEVCVVLARAFQMAEADADVLDDFADVDNVSSWAVDSMAAMVDAGYLAGDADGNLNPLSEMTRKDFAVVMSRLVDVYIAEAGTYSDDIDGTVLIRVEDVTLEDMDIADNLILGDGVGEGDITLDGITVGNTTLIRGGGENSIYAKGGSDLGDVIVYNTSGGVALKLSGSSTADSITVLSDDVTLTGLPSGTQVVVGDEVDGTSVNGKSVDAGETVTASSSTASSSGGGGSSTTTPTTPTTPTVTTSTLEFDSSIYSDTAIFAGTTYAMSSCITRNTDADDTITWEVDDTSIATIDTDGVLSMKKIGSVLVTVTANGISDSATVVIANPQSGDTITVDGTELTGLTLAELYIGEAMGEGSYTLTDCNITTLNTAGGGANSGHIDGGVYDTITMTDAPEDGSRLVFGDDAVVNTLAADADAIVETEDGESATIGTVTASSNLTVKNTSLDNVTTTGEASTLTLESASITALTATGETTIEADAASGKIETITASADITTSATTAIGVVEASDSANITTSGSVDAITGSAGTLSLSDAGDVSVTADATSLTVAGASAPVVSGTVDTVEVQADETGSTSVVITGDVSNVTTSGTGTVGSLSIESDTATEVSLNADVATISSSSAETTLTGSATVATVVATSGTLTVSSTLTTSTVLATSDAIVQGDVATEEVVTTLSRIAVTTYPTQLTYETDDSFDETGAVVTAYYSVSGNETEISKTVAATFAEVDGVVTASYTEDGTTKSTSFAIVRVAQTVNSIFVSKVPSKTAYEVGDSLDVANGTIAVTYTNSTLYPNETVSMMAATISGFDSTVAGSQTITVTYNGKTATFVITVTDPVADAQTAAITEVTNYAKTILSASVYSEAGESALLLARNNGITVIGNATSTADVNAALTTAKAAIDGVATQDEEYTATANSYTSDYSATLAIATESVAIADRSAVTVALYAYEGLEAGVQAKLTSQKTLLDNLLTQIAVLEAAQTLDAAQDSAVSVLETQLVAYATGYTTNLVSIIAAGDAGVTAIEAATTVAAVTTALDAALSQMASYQSDATIEAETLASAKADAKEVLASYWSGNQQADYSTAQQKEIAELQTAGKATINEATSVDEVATALAAVKGDIDLIQTTAEIAAAKLETAKAEAKLSLATYAGKYGALCTTNASDITAAQTAGETAIENATTTDTVAEALAEALQDMKDVPTDAEIATAALDTAKMTAIDSLNSYWGEGETEADYSTSGISQIESIRAQTTTSINSATTQEAIDAILTIAKTSIDGVETTAEKLVATQNLAITSLDSYWSGNTEADYSTANVQAIADIRTQYTATINAATTEEAVYVALSAAKIAIDAVLTSDEEDAEALNAAKAEGLADLATVYAGYAEGYTIKSTEIAAAYEAGVTAINAATTSSEVDAAVATAETAMASYDSDAVIEAAELAAAVEAYCTTYADVLALTAETVAILDKNDVTAAVTAYGQLSAGAQAELTQENALLSALSAQITVLEEAQSAAEALTTAKSLGLSSLETAYNTYAEADYTTNYAEITAAYDAGVIAVNAATTAALVDSAVDAAIAAMAEVESDADLAPELQTNLPLITEVTMYQSGMNLVGYIENPSDTTGIESYELCLYSSGNSEKNISRNILVGNNEGYFSFELLSSTDVDIVYDSIKVYTKTTDSSLYNQVISEISIEPITIKYGTIESDSLTYNLTSGYLSAAYTVDGGVGSVSYMGSKLYSGDTDSYSLIDSITSTYTSNLTDGYITYLGGYDDAVTETIAAGILIGAGSDAGDSTNHVNPATTAITGAYYTSDYINVTRGSSSSGSGSGSSTNTGEIMIVQDYNSINISWAEAENVTVGYRIYFVDADGNYAEEVGHSSTENWSDWVYHYMPLEAGTYDLEVWVLNSSWVDGTLVAYAEDAITIVVEDPAVEYTMESNELGNEHTFTITNFGENETKFDAVVTELICIDGGTNGGTFKGTSTIYQNLSDGDVIDYRVVYSAVAEANKATIAISPESTLVYEDNSYTPEAGVIEMSVDESWGDVYAMWGAVEGAEAYIAIYTNTDTDASYEEWYWDSNISYDLTFGLPMLEGSYDIELYTFDYTNYRSTTPFATLEDALVVSYGDYSAIEYTVVYSDESKTANVTMDDADYSAWSAKSSEVIKTTLYRYEGDACPSGGSDAKGVYQSFTENSYIPAEGDQFDLRIFTEVNLSDNQVTVVVTPPSIWEYVEGVFVEQ